MQVDLGNSNNLRKHYPKTVDVNRYQEIMPSKSRRGKFDWSVPCQKIEQTGLIKENLIAQLTGPVKWTQTIHVRTTSFSCAKTT